MDRRTFLKKAAQLLAGASSVAYFDIGASYQRAQPQVFTVKDYGVNIDLEFSSHDLALSVEDFSERFIKPAVAEIANRIDRDALEAFEAIHVRDGAGPARPDSLYGWRKVG